MTSCRWSPRRSPTPSCAAGTRKPTSNPRRCASWVAKATGSSTAPVPRIVTSCSTSSRRCSGSSCSTASVTEPTAPRQVPGSPGVEAGPHRGGRRRSAGGGVGCGPGRHPHRRVEPRMSRSRVVGRRNRGRPRRPIPRAQPHRGLPVGSRLRDRRGPAGPIGSIDRTGSTGLANRPDAALPGQLRVADRASQHRRRYPHRTELPRPESPKLLDTIYATIIPSHRDRTQALTSDLQRLGALAAESPKVERPAVGAPGSTPAPLRAPG